MVSSILGLEEHLLDPYSTYLSVLLYLPIGEGYFQSSNSSWQSSPQGHLSFNFTSLDAGLLLPIVCACTDSWHQF